MSLQDGRRAPDAWEVVAVLAVALLSVAALLLLNLAEGPVRYSIIGAIALTTFFALCGNVRLGLLWGIPITAPIGLCKRFMVTPNMGGASALQIDVVDFFVFPLAFIIIREFVVGIRSRSSLFVPQFAKWWMAFMAVGLVTLVLGPFRHLAFFEMFRMAKLLLLLLVIANEVVRRDQFRNLAAAIMASVALQSAVAMLQYALQHPLGLEELGEATITDVQDLSLGTLASKEFVYRVGGLVGHANFLATFLAAQLPIVLAMMTTGAPLRLRFLGFLSLGMGVIALVLTLSRTGWIAGAMALVGVMALSLLHPGLRAKFQLGRMLFCVGLVAVAVAFSGKIYSRIYASDEGAVDFRWELLDVAWKMGESSPVIGKGLNSFVFQMPEFTKYGSKEDAEHRFGKVMPVVHDVYALVWAEEGALGVFFFIGFICSLLVTAVSNLRARQEEVFALGVGCLMAVGAFLVDWVASFTLRSDGMGRVCFLVFGLVAAVERQRRSQPVSAQAAPTLSTGLAAAGST